MGTAIVRSQDCLRGRFRHDALALTLTQGSRRSSNFSNPNPSSNGSQSRRRKRSPVGAQPNHRDRMAAKVPGKNLVMGQVKILRRGEALNPATDDRKPRVEDSDLVLGSTDRLGPDPETVHKQIKAAELKIYAGSGAYYSSPPPSSVPLPTFLAKNGAATGDLRRLLRLDLV